MKKTELLSYLITGCCLLLSACITPVTQQKASDWQDENQHTEKNYFFSEGRLSIKNNGKGSYANFEWQSSSYLQSIQINTPLGNTVGVLCQDETGVVAKGNDNHIYTANNVNELSQNLAGINIPLQAIYLWATGRYSIHSPYTILEDGRLQQDGWTITRTTRHDHTPRNLLLTRPNISIQLIFDHFTPQPPVTIPQQTCPLRHEKLKQAI